MKRKKRFGRNTRSKYTHRSRGRRKRGKAIRSVRLARGGFRL